GAGRCDFTNQAAPTTAMATPTAAPTAITGPRFFAAAGADCTSAGVGGIECGTRALIGRGVEFGTRLEIVPSGTLPGVPGAVAATGRERTGGVGFCSPGGETPESGSGPRAALRDWPTMCDRTCVSAASSSSIDWTRSSRCLARHFVT